MKQMKLNHLLLYTNNKKVYTQESVYKSNLNFFIQKNNNKLTKSLSKQLLCIEPILQNMQYLNQTIVFMSEQNKELKEKVRRLEQICRNITETSRIVQGRNERNDHRLVGIRQGEFDQWQLNSPKSTKNEQPSINCLNYQQPKMINSQSTIQQSLSSSLEPISTHHLTIQNLSTQLQSLKDELSTTTQQLHQTQLEALQRANKIKELSSQLNRAKDEVAYLKKEIVREKEAMKGFYETTVVGEMRDRFEEDRREAEIRWGREKEGLEGQLRDLRGKVEKQARMILENEKQLSVKNAKQQRLLAVISELKLLIESSSQQHQEEITHFTSSIQSTNQQLTHLKLTYNAINEELQQKQHQNDVLQFEVKKLKQQISTIKRQHDRSISKTERELQRQRSVSKNIQKNYSMQRKIMEAELKKKQLNEKYHLKKQKELISKIKTKQGGESMLLTQQSKSNLSNLNLSSLSSIDMTKLDVSTRKSNYQAKSPMSRLNISNRMSQQRKSPSQINLSKKHQQKDLLTSPYQECSKPSFAKYLQTTPSNIHQSSNRKYPQAYDKKSKQSIISGNNTITPKSVVKLKANTIGVINSNRDKNQSLTVTAKTKKQSTPSTSRCHQQIQKNSTGNSISLKDTKYHNQTVTEFSLNPNDDGAQNKENMQKQNDKKDYMKNYNSPTLHLQESLEINNYSSIDILKDNLSYFPSNKTSKNNSPQKILPFQLRGHSRIDEQVEEEKGQEDKFSFNQHIEELRKLEHYMRASFNPNNTNNQRSFESEIGRKERDINSLKRQTKISQFSLVPENNELNHTPHYSANISTKRKDLIEEQLINKLLETQSSNQKQHKKDQISQITTRNRHQEIEELLTSTQRHFRTNNGQKSQKTTNQPFSFVYIASSNKKYPQPILAEKSIKNLHLNDQDNQQLYKPNKALMKLTDLDTPCFESALINEPKTNRDHAIKQSQQSYLIVPNSTRRNQQKRKQISISIANLNQVQTNLNK